MDIVMGGKTSKVTHTTLKNLNKVVMNEKFDDLKTGIKFYLLL